MNDDVHLPLSEDAPTVDKKYLALSEWILSILMEIVNLVLAIRLRNSSILIITIFIYIGIIINVEGMKDNILEEYNGHVITYVYIAIIVISITTLFFIIEI